MPRSCCVVMCGHGTKYCKMKRFPSDPKRAAVWESNVGRPDWKRTESSCVCECHFDATQFEQNRQDGAKKLRHNAVPLIFPTHVLVVHDPTGENKWLSPKPQPRPSKLQALPLRPSLSQKRQHKIFKPSQSVRKQHQISKPVKKKSKTRKADHMYAKNSADEGSQGDSIMCESFCPEDELDELEMHVESSSRMNEVAQSIQNGSSGETDTPDLSAGPSVSFRTRSRTSTLLKSPVRVSEIPEGRNKGLTTQSTVSQFQRMTEPLRTRGTLQYSPHTPLKTPNAHNEKSSPWKRQDMSQTSIEILDIQSEGESEAEFPTNECETTKVWDSEDMNGSTQVSPEVLKDALSFLQFMLPQKWLAFSENSGIHVVLTSRSKAKSIQRSVYVPFNGGKIELYVHAQKLSRDHEIFKNESFNETELLTHDSLGSFVDRIVNIVQLLSSYEICCGVTDREYLLVWRKFTDCMLDCNTFGEEKYDQTVRSVSCKLLAPKDGVRCKMCDTLYE